VPETRYLNEAADSLAPMVETLAKVLDAKKVQGTDYSFTSSSLSVSDEAWWKSHDDTRSEDVLDFQPPGRKRRVLWK